MSERLEDLKCPKCGESMGLDACDGDDDLVTYWAEGDPIEKECPACDGLVRVSEHIRRWWEVVDCSQKGAGDE
jgi:ribosomal protein S27AE